MDTKKCGRCLEVKPVDHFWKRKVGNNHYPASQCKDCRRDHRREKVSKGEWKSAQQLPSYDPLIDRAYRLNRANTARYIVVDSRRSDKKRGLSNDLTKDAVAALIADGCSYCGATELRMTVDRIDNLIGHVESNIVPSCYRCNIVRGTMPIEAWSVIAPAMKEAYNKGLFGVWRSEPISRKK